VRLAFVDVFGTSNALALPASRFELAERDGVVFDGSALEGSARSFESDMRLLPDRSTLVAVSPDVARVVCTVLAPDGTPWPGDPRTCLIRVVEELNDLGAAYRVSAELEYYLLRPDRSAIDQAGYFDDLDGVGLAVSQRAAQRLLDHGVVVQSVHHEAGPGQYEIDLADLPALGLADAIVLAKETVRRAAADAGLVATFMARPIEGRPGSGLHVHQHAGHELTGPDGSLTELGRSFVAGQLAHARGLAALASPNVNSYRRLHAGPEAPGAAMWAHHSRAALVRVSSDLRELASIEFRGADPQANPYLLLAGLLLAGAAGASAGLDLDPPSDESVGGYDPVVRTTTRYDPLPRSLDEALDALAADDVLVEGLDSALIDRLVDGRRAEAEEYRDHVTSWELERYLEGTS
jgi:glutamine synthetase